MDSITYTSDLGDAACRAVMRELHGKPVLLASARDPENPEATPPAVASGGQWCAVLQPGQDRILVQARLYLRTRIPCAEYRLAMLPGDFPGPGRLSPDGMTFHLPYPDDRRLITGPGYLAQLSAAAGRAADTASAQRQVFRAQAGHDARQDIEL